MKRLPSIIALLLSLPAFAAGENFTQRRVFLSQTYTIDRKYKSMEGPQSAQKVYLSEAATPELLWITGVRTEMVGEDGAARMLPELMCHLNVDLDIERHKELLNWNKNVSARVLTLSQGQLSARFPEGFGIPVLSNEPLILVTQVLNHNIEHPNNLKVRHKVTVEFVRDKDVSTPMRALYSNGIYGMALLEGQDGLFGMPSGDTASHGMSCLPGEQAPNATYGSQYADGMGRKFTGHWVVKPGREVNHTNVTKLMNLPFDTTLHYAVVHLHPFAKSLELRDLTTGKTLFTSHAEGPARGIGLTKVEPFSSREGIPLYKSHEYEIVSVYDNTTQVNQDSMAVMYLSAFDLEFKRPDAAALAAMTPAPAVGREARLVLRTTAGDMVFAFLPEVAPKASAQIARLVRSGAYDGVPFFRVEPGFVAQVAQVDGGAAPLTAEQRALIRRIPLEPSPVNHIRGVLSLARRDEDPNSGESSFSILLGRAPHLDGKYTVFGRLELGWDVLNVLENAARRNGATREERTDLFILKAEIVNSAQELATMALAGPQPIDLPVGAAEAAKNPQD